LNADISCSKIISSRLFVGQLPLVRSLGLWWLELPRNMITFVCRFSVHVPYGKTRGHDGDIIWFHQRGRFEQRRFLTAVEHQFDPAQLTFFQEEVRISVNIGFN
jgi:hypothetical protein